MFRAVVWQRFEGAVLFLASIAVYFQHHDIMPWWAALLCLLAPDLSFLGYILGPRIGAFLYNSVHIYAFGAIWMTLGMLSSHPLLTSLGALWLAHSGIDRMFRYGLKSPEGFTITHLGQIGKSH